MFFQKKKLDWHITLIDEKITFEKKTKIYSNKQSVIVFNEEKHSFSQLLDLVYLSGHDSRFLRDPIFGELNFKKLYKVWIENSIKDKSIKVLVYFDEKIKRILGFVTVVISTDISSIGLIAVSDSVQNLGIGKALIEAAENQLTPNSVLHVATQRSNIKACLFYKKLGFIHKTTDYIYHYANSSL